MSTNWTPLNQFGQPVYAIIPEVETAWQRIPSLTNIPGFGFGQGGFGQGGFGGNPGRSGTSIPNWVPWTTD